MATHKSFQTYAPTDGSTFDVNGQTFRLKAAVPGDILLDFMGGLDDKDTAKVAGVMRDLMKAALLNDAEYDRWTAFIRDPANNVTLNILGEVAGFVSERLAGNPTQPSPDMFTAG